MNVVTRSLVNIKSGFNYLNTCNWRFSVKKATAKHQVALSDEELNDVFDYERMLQQMERGVESLRTQYGEQLSLRTSAGLSLFLISTNPVLRYSRCNALLPFHSYAPFRRHTGIFDNLQVETADGKLPLIRLAQIQQKSAQLIVINLGASPQVSNIPLLLSNILSLSYCLINLLLLSNILSLIASLTYYSCLTFSLLLPH